jgi:hypothetical protein
MSRTAILIALLLLGAGARAFGQLPSVDELAAIREASSQERAREMK